MTLDTRVFRRMMEEHKAAAINAVADVMKQTSRFGCYTDEYVRRCAADLVEVKYANIQCDS